VGEGGGVKKLQDLLHASTHDHDYDESADPTDPSTGPRTVGRLKAGRWAGGVGEGGGAASKGIAAAAVVAEEEERK
jgi:hypothetical protein